MARRVSSNVSKCCLINLSLKNISTDQMSEQNPFASPPVIPPVKPVDDEFLIGLEERDRKKAEGVIKEAGTAWIVILCIPCCVFAAFTIPLYSIRLMQWNELTLKYPQLLASDVPRKSFQAKFKSARWKLITGLVVSSLILTGLLLLFIGG